MNLRDLAGEMGNHWDVVHCGFLSLCCRGNDPAVAP